MITTKIIQVSKNKRKKIKEYIPNVKKNKTAIKLEEIETSTVKTSNNNEFNADENSQMRLLRAINYLDMTRKSHLKWTLADGSKKNIHKRELKEAFELAFENHYNIWIGEEKDEDKNTFKKF